jgi:GDP-L-fucose synthase
MKILRFDDTSSPSAQFINRPKEACQLGTGIDCSIRDLALTIAKVVGFKGEVKFDATKPDGTMRKLMNVDRLTGLGWISKIPTEEGLISTYRWFLNNQGNVRPD